MTHAGNEKIIRNRLKIHAAVSNAKAYLQVQETYGSFDAFMQAIGMVNDHTTDCFAYQELVHGNA